MHMSKRMKRELEEWENADLGESQYIFEGINKDEWSELIELVIAHRGRYGGTSREPMVLSVQLRNMDEEELEEHQMREDAIRRASRRRPSQRRRRQCVRRRHRR